MAGPLRLLALLELPQGQPSLTFTLDTFRHPYVQLAKVLRPGQGDTRSLGATVRCGHVVWRFAAF